VIFQGRSVGGDDGCNDFGNVGAVWGDDGSISFDLTTVTTTLAGCPEREEITTAFTSAIRSATSWGFTPERNLVLVGPSIRLDLAFAGPVELVDNAARAPVSDTTLQLLRETELFAPLPDSAELPLLTFTNGATAATLTSSDCELTYSVALPASGEGPASFIDADPTTCPTGTTARAVADILTGADYALTLNVGEASLIQLWVGPRSAIFFATEGSGF